MRLFCCFNFKKKKNNKTNKKVSSNGIRNKPTNDEVYNSSVIENEKDNSAVKTASLEKDINVSMNTSSVAVTALTNNSENFCKNDKEISNVSSIEKTQIQNNHYSLKHQSLSTERSKNNSINDFKSAISIGSSSDSFYTTASVSSMDNNINSNYSYCSMPRTSISRNSTNTSFIKNNSLLIDELNNNTIIISPSTLVNDTNTNTIKYNNEKQLNNKFVLSTSSNHIIDTNFDTNTKNISKIKKQNESSYYSTNITIKNDDLQNNISPVHIEAYNISINTKKPSIKKEKSANSYNTANSSVNNESILTDIEDESSNKGKKIKKSKSKNSNWSLNSKSKAGNESSSKNNLRTYSTSELNNIAERALHPDLTDYTLDSTIKNRIKVYSRVRPSTGINEYIILGYLDKVTLREAYEVYMDLEYRKEWDELKQQINIFERKNKKKGKKSSSSISNDLKDFEIHWEIKLPWPFSNREYVFERNTYEHKYNDMIFLIADNSSLDNDEEVTQTTENFGTIRITEYEQITVFYSDKEDGKCNVYMEYYDDPKGNIPLMLKNWVIGRAAPNFVMNIEKACKEYKAFERRLANNRHVKELNYILGKSIQEAFDDFEL